MIPFAAWTLMVQANAATGPVGKRVSLIMASTVESADSFERLLNAGEVSKGDAEKKGYLREERSNVWIYIDRSLVDDMAIEGIDRVVAVWKDGRLPSGKAWSDLSKDERRLFGSLLAQGSSGRNPGVVEQKLRDRDASFVYSVMFDVPSGDDPHALSGFVERTDLAKQTPSRATNPAGNALLDAGRTTVLRTTRGFPRKMEADVVGGAYELLDKLRLQRLERAQKALDDEAWKKLRAQLANPKGWDGKTPIRYADLDPVLKQMASQNPSTAGLKPDDMVGPIRFRFYIGFGKGDGATVSSLFSAYR